MTKETQMRMEVSGFHAVSESLKAFSKALEDVTFTVAGLDLKPYEPTFDEVCFQRAEGFEDAYEIVKDPQSWEHPYRVAVMVGFPISIVLWLVFLGILLALAFGYTATGKLYRKYHDRNWLRFDPKIGILGPRSYL